MYCGIGHSKSESTFFAQMKKSINIAYEQFDDWQELPKNQQARIERLQTNLANAYAPYSRFQVSSLVVMSNGVEVFGTNQENIAYPSGMCAERVALYAAKSQYPENDVLELYVFGRGELLSENAIISPCGACRQVIAEVQTRQNESITVYLVGANRQVIVLSEAKDLLPFQFGV